MTTTPALVFDLAVNTIHLTQALSQGQRAVTSGLRGMAAVVQTEGAQLQKALDGIVNFRKLKLGMEAARGELDSAKRAAAEAKSAFASQREALQRMRSELRGAGVDTTRLAEGQRQLRESLACSTAELRCQQELMRQQQRLQAAREVLGMPQAVNVEREIARVQAAYERLRAAGTLTAAELSRAHLAMTTRIIELRNGTEGWASRLALVREQLAKLAVAGAALGASTLEAIRFESAMSDVRKVVDLPSSQSFAELTAGIKGLAREIPVTLEGLARIAEAGGQMGIAAKDIMGFTEVVAQMGTAFKISPDEAGTAIGRLMNVFALTVPQTRLLADAINHLGNRTNAVERDLVEVMNRAGGMARVFRLTNTETAALSATFLSMGLGPERSATAVNALLHELMNAPQQTDKFKSALQRIGLTSEELAAAIHQGPQQAILELLEILASLDDQTKMETLVGLFGDLYSDEIVQVVNNLDQYRVILGLVGQESNYAGSMQREFGERIRTTEAQLQLARNAISEAAINLGTAFLPAVVAAARAVAVLGQGVADLVATFPTLAAVAAGALTAFAGFGALRLAWSLLRGGVLALLAPLAGVARGIGVVTLAARGLMATPLGLALTAAGLAAMGLASYLSSAEAALATTGQTATTTAARVASIVPIFRQLATSLAGAVSAARKAVVEAIGVADQQLTRYQQGLGQQRQLLQQAVEAQRRSWQAMAEAAAAAAESATTRVTEEHQRQVAATDSLVAAGMLSASAAVARIATLEVQAATARLEVAKRHQAGLLTLIEREYATRVALATRLGVSGAQLDQERLQAQRKVMEQTEAARELIPSMLPITKPFLSNPRILLPSFILPMISNAFQQGQSPWPAKADYFSLLTPFFCPFPLLNTPF